MDEFMKVRMELLKEKKKKENKLHDPELKILHYTTFHTQEYLAS